MKIYFNVSARVNEAQLKRCELIEKTLVSLGHTLVWDWRKGNDSKKIYSSSDDELAIVFSDALKNMSSADLFLAEVSVPSVTQGFLIDRALQKEKCVIALADQGHVPVFLKAITNPRFCLAEYDEESVEDVLTVSIDLVSNHSDSRFTMLMPDDLVHHLDVIASKGMSRSEYIRDLIRNDMEQT